MGIAGYYYLHENGSLIWKRETGDGPADLRESDFVTHFWPLDLSDRGAVWSLLVEACAIGADMVRVNELADKWGCDDIDAQRFADYLGFKLYPDGSAWCAARQDAINLQESPHGFSERSALEAMADLAKQLGMRPQKMWGPTFASLVEVGEAA